MFGSQNTFNCLYTFDGTLLEGTYLVVGVRDLGVIFDTSLSSIPHILFIISEAFQMLGFIKRQIHDFYNTNHIRHSPDDILNRPLVCDPLDMKFGHLK